jgi:hypothetical protein
MSGRSCKLIVVKPERRGGYMPSQVMTKPSRKRSDAASRSMRGSTHRESDAGLFHLRILFIRSTRNRLTLTKVHQARAEVGRACMVIYLFRDESNNEVSAFSIDVTGQTFLLLRHIPTGFFLRHSTR